MTFLKYMKGLKPYVRIIEGDVVHMDYSTDSSQRLHLKTFSDLLMLSGAERVFLLKSPKMYNGGFPRMGAMIGNRPFRLVRFMY